MKNSGSRVHLTELFAKLSTAWDRPEEQLGRLGLPFFLFALALNMHEYLWKQTCKRSFFVAILNGACRIFLESEMVIPLAEASRI